MTAVLRVLHLAKHAPPARGGIETAVAETVRELARDPRDTSSVFLCFAPRSGTESVAPGVTVRRSRTFATVASAPLSWAMAHVYLRARRSADIVHVHVPNPWAVLLVLLFPARGAIVVSAHATSSRYGPLQAPHDWLMRMLYRRAAAVIASARSNVRLLGLDESRVRIIPYGIGVDRAVPSQDRSPARRQVLFVGRLVYYKGLDALSGSGPFLPDRRDGMA